MFFFALVELPGFKAVRVPHLPAPNEAGRWALKNASEKDWIKLVRQASLSVGLTCLNRTDRIFATTFRQTHASEQHHASVCGAHVWLWRERALAAAGPHKLINPSVYVTHCCTPLTLLLHAPSSNA